jgi:hypothetical protein
MAVREDTTDRQVLFVRVATVVSLLLAAVAGFYVYIKLASMEASVFAVTASAVPVWAWRALLGTCVALVVFGTLYLVVDPWARRFRSVETKAALKAVSIVDFDWETTTLEFADDEYADRFVKANQGAPED